MENLYKEYDEIIEVFKNTTEYKEILKNIDYFYQYLANMSLYTNNFFAMPIAFNGLSLKTKLSKEMTEEEIMSLLENIKSTHMLDLGVLLENSKRTLYSFRLCIEVVNISDALTLFRRFKDDLFLLIYFIRLSKPRDCDYDTETNLKQWNKDVKDAKDWASNRMKGVYYTKIIRLLKKDELINQLDKKLNIFKYLIDVTEKLNNYAHSNGMNFLNISSPIHNRRGSALLLKYINTDLNTVISYLITILFYISPEFLMSNDFIDYKDAGLEPPEGCQYLVAPFHQQLIDDVLYKVNPSLKDFLKNNTSMNIT